MARLFKIYTRDGFTALDFAVMRNDITNEVFEFIVNIFLKANISVN